MFSDIGILSLRNMQQILTSIPVTISLTFKQRNNHLYKNLSFFKVPFQIFSLVNALVNF